ADVPGVNAIIDVALETFHASFTSANGCILEHRQHREVLADQFLDLEIDRTPLFRDKQLPAFIEQGVNFAVGIDPGVLTRTAFCWRGCGSEKVGAVRIW